MCHIYPLTVSWPRMADGHPHSSRVVVCCSGPWHGELPCGRRRHDMDGWDGKPAPINQSSNSSDASLPSEASSKGVVTADGSPPLPIHTLPACPFQPISPHSLSLTYSFTLSSHLPSGLPHLFVPSTLLKYTLLTNSSFPILSIWPNLLRVHLFTHSTTPHPTPCPRPLMPHFSDTLSLLRPSHLLTPHAPLK